MSIENARAVYPILTQLAKELSTAIKQGRSGMWVTYEEFCLRCRDVGLKETPRTVVTKVLKPLQVVCLENEKPDLSALVIQKPRARSDTGQLLRPSDGWWEIYVERGETATGDIRFWFATYKVARDYEWPEEPFF